MPKTLVKKCVCGTFELKGKLKMPIEFDERLYEEIPTILSTDCYDAYWYEKCGDEADTLPGIIEGRRKLGYKSCETGERVIKD